ncbi:VanZ family protein [Halobacillus sp. BBL2006]|uniref:VanZ family protein n=1 Tax=Halobacillus sp. BBL2006 TaxID=1543706 RepID=UPI00068D8BF2|nr:VanZ family protein [Halobacillus sp. BBL2006]
MTVNTVFESLHVVEFAFLYLLVVLALIANGKFSKKTNVLAAFLAMTYGFVDEVHQLYVVDRSFTAIDLVKDWGGVWIAWWLVHHWNFKEKKESAIVDA